MILLQASNVACLFGADILFDNVQMTIQDTSKIALVGRNGAGKSTLLKMIAGITKPDQGQIIVSKNTKIGYLAQNAELDSDKTMFDELLTVFEPLQKMEHKLRQMEEQMAHCERTQLEQLMSQYDHLQHEFTEQNGYRYEADIRSILHHFHFTEDDWQRPVNTLSGGQKTRLALAKMLMEQPDLLILDEPTNHLDIETLTWLEDYLKGYKGALLIVSHDRYFLDKVVNEVYELSHHQMNHYHGNYSAYTKEKAKQYELASKQYAAQQQEIKKMEDFIARNIARSSTTRRAQSRQKQLDKMEKLDRPQGDEKSAHFSFPIRRPSGNIVFQMENGGIGYDQTVITEPINIDLRRTDAIAIVGPNGIGKSTLLKTIIKQIPLIHGTMNFGTNVDLGYYDQEHQTLHPQKTVLNELWDEHATTPERDIRMMLGHFLFSGDDVTKTVGMLSGGERARLLLAKLAMQQENFLVLDEPTNHLDLDSKEVLESALVDYEGSLLFVSHDRYFINHIATKVLEITEEGSKLYLGNYDYYLEKKMEEEEKARLLAEQEKEKQPVTPSKQTNQPISKEKQRTRRKLQRDVDRLEEAMMTLEEKETQLQEQMVIAGEANDSVQLMDLQKELDAVTEELETIMSQWEEAAQALETFDNQA